MGCDAMYAIMVKNYTPASVARTSVFEVCGLTRLIGHGALTQGEVTQATLGNATMSGYFNPGALVASMVGTT